MCNLWEKKAALASFTTAEFTHAKGHFMTSLSSVQLSKPPKIKYEQKNLQYLT